MKHLFVWLSRITGRCVIAIVRCYQILISPWLGANCRFTPTCSAYMIEAITKYGCIRGTYRGFRRIFRCHPWHPGGHDPP